MNKFLVEQFWKWDTSTFRVFFAASSWAFGFIIYFDTPSWNSQIFDMMRMVGGQQFWGCAFVLHWALLSLCLLPTFRYCLGFNTAVNLFGFFLWGLSVVLQDAAAGHITITSSMETVALFFSFLTILRHGFVARVSDII